MKLATTNTSIINKSDASSITTRREVSRLGNELLNKHVEILLGFAYDPIIMGNGFCLSLMDRFAFGWG